ncbi:MAG: hypothetical protein HQK56_14905 [Deltaproteobacteria bacterium]|nr:hypothetical protein [Deltaproteobacteria bacterium]
MALQRPWPTCEQKWTQGSGVSTYSRTFDQDGRVSGITFSGTGGNQTISLTYDLAGRITGITDSNGVRPSITTGTTSYSISGAGNRLQSRTGPSPQTYTYDAAGNLTADGTNTYTYDARGRLVQVITGGVTTSYAINGLGQRVQKSGTTTTIFVYGESGQLFGEYDSAGSVIQETVWLGNLPVGVLKTGAVYYVNPDHLGSPKSIIDASGTTVWKWDKDPFGNGAPTGTLPYNLRFPGQYFDVETGLCYNMARDYNPGLGRYIQSDPIGLAGGINTYAYVGGNPINGTDPSGLKTYLCFDSPHFSVCVDNQCAGLYLDISCPGLGKIYKDPFQPSNCQEIKAPACCNQARFDNCVRKTALMRRGECSTYTFWFENCLTWAKEVIANCKVEACAM